MTPEQKAELLKCIGAWDGSVGEAALVRYDEMEAYVDAMIAQARADEREACAKVCDERAEWLYSNMHALKAEQSETLAAAIRARKDHDE